MEDLADPDELKWTELRILGQGAFGKVAECITHNGKLIAIKHLALPNTSPAYGAAKDEIEELVGEIQLLKALRHRHIVEYYGCRSKSEVDGTRAVDIFMEHCHGGSLNTLRRRFDRKSGRLSVVLVRCYIRQVLRGLCYLHRKGVVHRDIKGDNVLISGTGDAKLADFGCSKKLGTSVQGFASDAGPTGVGCNTLVGTPLFMAPEVMKEEKRGYNNSADIWSVGCLTIELFGQKPWRVHGTTLFAVMYAIASAKGLPTGMPDQCDGNFRLFLESCFQREPRRRPTAHQLLQTPWMTCPDHALVEPVWNADDPM